MNAPSLSPCAALALPLHPSIPQTCHLALVTRVERGAVTVVDEDGAVIDIAGVVDVGVGDHVVVNDAGAVVDVLPRRSALWRAREQGGAQLLAANVDVVFCVVAADQGLRPRRLERALALAYDSGAEPVVVITKADLVDDDALAALVWQSEGLAPGVAVVSTSTHRTDGVDALRGLLLATDDDGEPRARVAVMLGVSGAGKSALTNALLGKDVITEGALSADGLRGAHTTTSRSVHLVPGGGVVIDTPGLRSCRFRDCAHDGQPGCAVVDVVSAERLASYRRLQREAERHRARELGGAAIAERRRQERSFGRLTSEAQAHRRKRRGDE